MSSPMGNAGPARSFQSRVNRFDTEDRGGTEVSVLPDWKHDVWMKCGVPVAATGAIMGPLEAFLCSRGMKTLELRVREQCRTAQQLAEWLAAHGKVNKVLYPGLPTHPGYEIAKQQMDGGFGAMLSFELAGDFKAAQQFVESTRLFQLAVSLGAVESLIEQPASMSHASYAPEDRAAYGITDGMIRLSVGLEDVKDLQADLEQAFAQI